MMVMWFACSIRLAVAAEAGRVEEAVVVQYDFKGSVGNYPVTLHLRRAGRRLEGDYVYDRHAKSPSLYLYGGFDPASGRAQLTEWDAAAKRRGRPVAHWTLTLTSSSGQGEWSEGTQRLPIALHADPHWPALPFELRVRVRQPEIGGDWFDPLLAPDDCRDGREYATEAIALYRDGKLFQSLDGGPWPGNCAPALPEVQDVEFDGRADLLVPRGKNYAGMHAYDYWEYRPDTGRFERSHALDAIFSGDDEPSFDPVRKRIGMDYYGTGSPDFLSVEYAWHDGRPVVVWRKDCDHVPASPAEAKAICRISTQHP